MLIWNVSRKYQKLHFLRAYYKNLEIIRKLHILYSSHSSEFFDSPNLPRYAWAVVTNNIPCIAWGSLDLKISRDLHGLSDHQLSRGVHGLFSNQQLFHVMNGFLAHKLSRRLHGLLAKNISKYFRKMVEILWFLPKFIMFPRSCWIYHVNMRKLRFPKNVPKS